MLGLQRYLSVLALAFLVSVVSRAATYTVTSLDDTGEGTLRWALEQAAANNGADTIEFAVSGTISSTTALPEITDDETVLDASAQWQGIWPDGEPGVCLDGSSAPSATVGLVINGAANCRISGLAIVNFPSDGVSIECGAQQNTIGGTETGQRNVISGNGNDGIYISGSNTDVNVIQGNRIGTDPNGTDALPNGKYGIVLSYGASKNTIGTSFPDNTISGNVAGGILIRGAATTGNTVAGNRIGVNINEVAAPNGGSQLYGITIEGGANGNRIGGTSLAGSSDGGNMISANAASGILIADSGTTGNVIGGNRIGIGESDGTDITAGNGTTGVHIRGGAAQNVIGGMLDDIKQVVASGNRIAANASDGILVEGAGTDGNRIIANEIGGEAGFGNGGNGVNVIDGASDTVIGTAEDGEGNVIGDNSECGVRIDGSETTGTTVRGNMIGTDDTGTEAQGNLACGIRISGGATSNTIGGTADGAANIISGNTENGIEISGASTASNTVLGNLIGIDVDGVVAIPNQHNGILLSGSAANNTIGSTEAGGRNTISGNMLCGVRIEGSGTADNTVLGNTIGLSKAGTAVVPNGLHGVFLNGGASGNTIGGSLDTSGNVITGNADCGVRIEGDGTDSNFVRGNLIGLGPDGNSTIANSAQQTGVDVASGASNNTVGGSSDTRNIISDNAVDGIHIQGIGTCINEIDGNRIGTNADGDSAIPNGSTGIHVSDNASDSFLGSNLGNLVSGNDGIGIHIDSAPYTSVIGNTIGLELGGSGALGNDGHGVLIAESAGVNVLLNRVCSNSGSGIVLEGTDTADATIVRNWIGTNADAGAVLGNGGDGVLIRNGATVCTVGPENEIAHNGRYGVSVDGATTSGHTITQNRIHDNAYDGIGLLNHGNADAAAPMIELAELNDTGSLTVEGVLSSSPNVEIEVFIADSAVSGEGAAYVGLATTSADGTFELTVDVSETSLAAGDAVTATATPAPTGDTSSFAVAFEVTEANHAPTLTAGAPAFPEITEDDTTNTGVTVAWLLARSTADDQDGDTLGVAVTATTSERGTWQVQPGGEGDWSDLDEVSADQALLLAFDTHVRLLPDEENGTIVPATLTYVAWDGTDEGIAGTRVDARTRGGETAFSTTADSATLTVEDVNDAPVLSGTGYTFAGIGEDDTDEAGVDIANILLGAFSDCDENDIEPGIAIVQQAAQNGTWQYRLSGPSTWVDVPPVSSSGALLLDSAAELRFRPNAENGGASSFTYHAWDGSVGTSGSLLALGTPGGTSPFSSASRQATVAVNASNDAPTGCTLSNDTVPEHTPGAMVGELLAADVDDGDSHTFEITADPDAMFRIVDGTQFCLRDGVLADIAVAEEHDVTVQVEDAGGQTFSQTFTITVTSDKDTILLPLAPGWNLLALPFRVTGDAAPEAVFAGDAARDCLVATPVWLWDVEQHSYSCAEALEAEVGFWAWRGGEATSSRLLDGIVEQERPALAPGWNLIGIPADMTLAEYRTLYDGTMLVVWAWDPDEQVYTEFSESDTLQRGIGYWVFYAPAGQ